MDNIGRDIEKAALLLKAGSLVAIPTETVYGLAANALNPDAVLKIYEVKKRPFFDPLIIHIHALEQINHFVTRVPEKAKLLAEQYWPGPLTLILPRTSIIPDIVCSGLPHVAIRIPRHPLSLQLLASLDFPLAAPSANPFGYVSPTQATHVADQLGNEIAYILDGGACEVGLESTIIGFNEEEEVQVYRLGGLALEEIEKITGPLHLNINHSSNPRAPGQLQSHYATRKKLIVGKNLEEELTRHAHQNCAVISFCKEYRLKKPAYMKVLSASANLQEAAQGLFAAMRQLDETDADLILAEFFPDTFLGKAINDRLQRASSGEE